MGKLCNYKSLNIKVKKNDVSPMRQSARVTRTGTKAAPPPRRPLRRPALCLIGHKADWHNKGVRADGARRKGIEKNYNAAAQLCIRPHNRTGLAAPLVRNSFGPAVNRLANSNGFPASQRSLAAHDSGHHSHHWSCCWLRHFGSGVMGHAGRQPCRDFGSWFGSWSCVLQPRLVVVPS